MGRWRHIPEEWPPKKTTVEIQVAAPAGSQFRYFIMHATRRPCEWVTTTGKRLSDDQVTAWRPVED